MNISLANDLLYIDMGSHGRNRLAIMLAHFADEMGRRVFPSLELMAARMRCSVRQVQRYLADLRGAGVLVEVMAAGRARATEYAFNMGLVRLLKAGKARFDDLMTGRATPVSDDGDTQLVLPGMEGDAPPVPLFAVTRAERVTDVTASGDGGVTRVGNEVTSPPARGDLSSEGSLRAKLVRAAGPALSADAKGLGDLSTVRGWITAGADLEMDILPMIALRCQGKEAGTVFTWAYFTAAVLAAAARRTAVVDLEAFRSRRSTGASGKRERGSSGSAAVGPREPAGDAEREALVARNREIAVELYRDLGIWDERTWGPKPDLAAEAQRAAG